MLVSFVADASWLALYGGIALVLFASSAAFMIVGCVFERSAEAARHRVFALAEPPLQRRREKLAGVRFNLVAAAVICVALRAAPIDPTASGFAAGAGTFVVCWVSFEISYWILHRALHTRALFRFHRWHHDSRVTTPFTGLSTSAVEAFGWGVAFVLGPLALTAFGEPVSLAGFIAYLAYNYSGNLIGHVNAEFFPDVLGNRVTSWLVHPVVYHSLHHARFRKNYAFASAGMDRLFGTEWHDWTKLFARVRAGQPMKSLAERG